MNSLFNGCFNFFTASTFNSEAAPIELTAEDLSKLHGPSTEPKDVSVSEDNKSHQVALFVHSSSLLVILLLTTNIE